ncbi:hypothetical protein AAG565_03940 [Fontimonas sp. SYSU GA230001]|uniref:hypothetical protein n=1 Tax=Fontimonas sp. SYSU GA230001 TaxID=3142450 RepID=UPI0032B3714B
MHWINLSLLLILAAGLIMLWRRLGRYRALLATLQEDHRALAGTWGRLPPDAAELLAQQRTAVISIEILNPIELAAQESEFAGPISTIAPNLIRRIVYQKTAAILRTELSEKGVQADVKVHGLA